MVIQKKVLRTMRQQRAQYAGSLLLILVSCLLFTLLNQLAVNFRRSIRDVPEKRRAGTTPSLRRSTR